MSTSLQALHIHLDVASVSKHNYQSFAPPPPSAPVFGGQSALWWDPMNPGTYPPGSVPLITTGGKTSKTSTLRTKTQGRNFGSIKGLHNLSITAIDDLSCLEEISSCIKASSGTLKTLTLSFAESLVSRSQKPHPSNAHNNPPIQDDDATTEPGSPNMNAVGSAPSDLDLKREKEAQDLTLTRIFGMDKVPSSVQKQDRKVEKSLKRTAKSTHLAVPSFKSLDKLAAQILEAVQSSKFKAPEKAKMQDLLQAVFPPLPNGGLKTGEKSHESEPASKKKKWPGSSTIHPTGFGEPADGLWGISEEFVAPSNKEAQDYLTQLADFDFDPNSSTSAPTNGSNGWSQVGPLTLSSSTSKSAFAFNDDTLFPSLVPKPHPPAPAYPVTSQSYSFHPNSSSQLGNSVSQPPPLHGTTSHADNHHAAVLLQQVVQKAHQVGLHNPDSIPEIEALLQTLPPNLYQQAKLALIAHTDNIFQSHGTYSSKKGKKKPLPAPITPNETSSDSSSDSESDSKGNSSNVQPVALTRTNTGQTNDQDSDFDMDHPDVIETEDETDLKNGAEEDREVTVTRPLASQQENDDDDATVDGKKDKGKQKMESEDLPVPVSLNPNDKPRLEITKPDDAVTESETANKKKTLEESIWEYIRVTHGYSIEELVLCFIPLKTAVLARALDLQALRGIVFYNVGAQATFWLMVDKLIHHGMVFNLESIYTDDVSPAFVSCLANLPGLKSLHLFRRSSKEFSSTSSKPPASLADIHKIALTKHFETLQSLSMTNLEDDSWDIDDRLVRILASKAKKLRELAVSIDSNGFVSYDFHNANKQPN